MADRAQYDSSVTDPSAIHEHLSELIESAAAVAGQAQLRDVLSTTVQRATKLTGARYGALGVVGRDSRLIDFYHVGVDDETVRKIGHYPEGKGILGLITSTGECIRLDRVADHPEAAGFPPHHPIMETFLGAPIRVGNQIFGNLYLTEKPGGFTEGDEVLVESLAVIAGSAISNARIHDQLLRAALVQDRARIARDLHDAIIQELYAVGLSLQSLGTVVDDDRVRADLEVAVDRLDESIAALRRFIFDLRPPVWAERRLERELRQLVREMSLAYSAQVDLSCAGELDGISETTLDTAALAVREALSNALRHAQAQHIGVEVTVEDGELRIGVTDDGVGFDPDAVERGMGLDNLRQRSRQRGGDVEITSQPGDGTRVQITLPL
jgi:signal transduction histidine kinase